MKEQNRGKLVKIGTVMFWLVIVGALIEGIMNTDFFLIGITVVAILSYLFIVILR